jgi:hypothetical protein
MIASFYVEWGQVGLGPAGATTLPACRGAGSTTEGSVPDQFLRTDPETIQAWFDKVFSG